MYSSRGIPEDASPITKACAEVEGDDVGKHSWLTLQEMLKIPDDDPVFKDVLSRIEEVSHGGPIRIIFWFDR
jgi:hypothetical protein